MVTPLKNAQIKGYWVQNVLESRMGGHFLSIIRISRKPHFPIYLVIIKHFSYESVNSIEIALQNYSFMEGEDAILTKGDPWDN